jgi:cellulose biosynthesis protein BcsQ
MYDDISLITWTDVEEFFYRAYAEQKLPNYIYKVVAYWSSVEISIKKGNKDALIEWVAKVFDPRYDELTQSIILKSVSEIDRKLPVIIEETNDNIPELPIIPSFRRPSSIINQKTKPKNLEQFNENDPPVIAFHSFKGGVGRTLCAVTLAIDLSLKNKSRPVLIIDGDLEAPGLSYLIKKEKPTPGISYSDFLTLCHGEYDLDLAIDIVAQELKNQKIENVFVLPSFRNKEQFRTLEIDPGLFTKIKEDPYYLTSIITKLGKKLGVSAIIVDLRAGLSELSAGLILDPRVYRVIVTTLSEQSLEGTNQLLQELERISELIEEDTELNEESCRYPSLIVNKIPEEIQNTQIYEDTITNLLSKNNGDVEDTIHIESIIDLTHNYDLICLSNDWNSFSKKIKDTGFIKNIRQLSSLFPLAQESPTMNEDASKNCSHSTLIDNRNKLEEFTEKMIYAESSLLTDFLATKPLTALADNFSTRIPIAIIIGSKGSGKTYTANQMFQRENWDLFVNDIGKESKVKALMLPVLGSRNNIQEMDEKILITRSKTKKALHRDGNFINYNIYGMIQDELKKDGLSISDWKNIWLNLIAYSLGFPYENDSWKNLFSLLNQQNTSVIAIIDGLEDIFPELNTNEKQRVALNGLLQEVPLWLEQLPNQPIGLIVFVRKDMVNNAITQNRNQFINRYNPYELNWNKKEALRLVDWICEKSKINISKDSSSDELNVTTGDLVESLYDLWGRKLGKDNSKEAKTAEWVLGALSDFNGLIQPRDLVRLIYIASKDSKSDTRWADRILVPKVIRESLRKCSSEKIDEISEENFQLKEIFDKIKSAEEKYRSIPFKRDDLDLTADEIALLNNSGMLILDNEVYWMPEIIRQGLNFSMKSGGRARVLRYSKNKLNWND